MPKLVITGDWHARLARPRARLDEDFWATFETKVREVYSIAEAERADAIICPGDVFDSPNAGYSLLARMIRLLKDSPCEIWAIWGNHDEFAGNAATRERTPLGILMEMKLVVDLEAGDGKFLPVEADALVTGHGYDTETDRDMSQYLPPTGRFNAKTRLHVAHGMLLERSPGIETMRFTTLADIAAQPNAPKVLCVGHDHLGFGIKKVKDTLFINPGALMRLSAHPAEFERPIQVAVLEIDLEKITARLVPLQSAKPGHEVLSREHLEAAALREEKTASFLALLGAGEEMRALEISEIIDRIATQEQLPAEVRVEALARIGAAREGKAG